MATGPSEIFGITVYVPDTHLDLIMDSIDEVMSPVYPSYRRSFTYFPVTCTWKSLEGSEPFSGTPGTVTTERMQCLKFICRKEDLPAVLKKIDEAHPFEEPAVDVVPELGWRSLY